MSQAQPGMHALPLEGIDSLRSRMRGLVLCARDDGYDAARHIHNGMIDHRPAVIAQCRGAADVIVALEYAHRSGLPVSIRGGGHGVSGFAVCDQGVMIDLSLMNGVRVDPVLRTARAEGGATWGGLRPRDTSLRAGHDGWSGANYRDRGAHARGRSRIPCA
jgi:hypothetical protein